MAHVLKQVTTQYSLDHTQYALASLLPSQPDPKSLKPQTPVSDLLSADLVVVKRHKVTTATTGGQSVAMEKPVNNSPPSVSRPPDDEVRGISGTVSMCVCTCVLYS